ncbi:MAG TPA: hypothetical protein VID03_01935 [Acidimicrobiia bacterium]
MAVRQKGVRLVGRGNRVRLSLSGRWEVDPIEDVRDACRVDMAAEKLLYQSVQKARESGHSWAEIGRAMGVSRQAAWERFSRGLVGRGW